MKIPTPLRRSLFISLVAFFALSFISHADAATYYLAPNGSDTNACTLAAPCFSLKRAWQIIAPGDTVYLRGGTYAYSNMQYLQGRNGTAGNLIKIWAYPGETPNITRSSTYKIVNGVDQDLIYLEGNYFHFKGIEISYFEQKPDETGYPAFRAGFTSGSIFENINYHHNMSAFQIRGNSTGNLILNSDFHHNKDPYGPAPYDGADGLGITFNYDTNSVNTIRGCRAYWNADDGFDTWENQGSVIIENSWAFFNGYIPDTFSTAGNGTAFKLGSMSTPSAQTRRTLKNNLAYKNRFAGFVENNAGVKMELYNNTSVNAGYTGYWFGAWSGNGNVTIAKNNLDYQGGNPPGPWNSASTISNNSWQNNISVTNADFANMTDSQLMNPRKTDGSLPDITFLSLAASSDLINAGTPISGMSYSGTAPDIGAFEYGGTVVTPPSTTFTIGQRVQVSATSLNVRATASATGTLLGAQANGVVGTVTGGPTAADGYVWWNINYDTGVDGWSAESFLTAYTAPANTAPTANAGSDQTIALPTSSVTLSGSGTDVGGSIASYAWTKVSTLAGSITSSGSASTTVTSLAQGTHTFRLTVTDNGGLTASDDVVVIVSPQQTTTGIFSMGQTVQVYGGSVRVRAAPTTSGASLGTQTSGALGTVVGGPITANNYIWWNINYNTGADGWSIQNRLTSATAPAPDTTAPTTPTNLTGTGTTNTASLAWIASTDNIGVSGYRIFRSTTSAGTYTQIGTSTTTSYTDTGLTASTTHYYKVSAYDAAGNISAQTAAKSVATTAATTTTGVYYLAPSGSDTNPCTITAPCFTLQKAWTLVTAGDTVYLRGGTYTYTKQQGLTGKNGTAGNLIKVWAYPGETPVITRSATGYTTDIYWHRSGIFFTGNYVHFKGLEITGFKNISGNVEDGLLAYDANNNIFEQLNIHHNFHGMYIENNSSNNLILNCDFHDNYTDHNGGGDSDGLGISYNTGANNVVQGSRAWNNGDDGFDTFEAKGLVTFKNSWAWHNGYQYGTSTPAGNGVGFKLGSNFLQGTSLQNTVVRVVQNTISVDNRDSGYHINEGDHRTQLYNNISYANSNTGLNFHWNNLVHTFKNNVSFGNANRQVEVSGSSISTNNSYGAGYSDGGTGWAQTASAADFVSVDISQLDNARQSDGSLPVITAFTLASTSDLINAGTNVGLPYNGTAPDIGAFEYAGTTTTGDTTAPTVTLTAPTAGATLSGVASTISATASDNVGVSKVEFYRGTALLATDTNSSYSTSWDTTTVANGSYSISAKAYDAAGNATSSATVSVTVNNVTAPAPDTTAPTTPTNLTGTGTTNTASLAWIASTDNIGVSGYRIFRSTTSAGTYTQIGTSTTTSYTDTGLTASTTYYYKVSAYDAAGNVSTQSTSRSVATTAVANTAPTANAGSDQTIALPTSSVTLSGSGTDTDGSIATYAWTKVSGGSATITSPSSTTTTVTGLTEGTYSFWLTVTDNAGATNADAVVITVNPDPNTGGGGGSVGFSDLFNRANNTALGSDWVERYGASNFRINTNRLQLNLNDSEVSSAHTTAGITSANYTVSSQISFPNKDNIMYAGISGRRTDFGTTDSNGYMVLVEIYDQLLTLYKRVDGEWARLGEYTITLPAGTFGTIGLSMQGSTIEALWNGASVISVSDSTFSGAGSAGAITGSGFPMTGVRWDDFSITP